MPTSLANYVDRPCRKALLAPIGCSSNLCPYEDHPFSHRVFDGTFCLNLSSDLFAFPEAEWDRIPLELQALKPEVLKGEPVLPFAAGRGRRSGGGLAYRAFERCFDLRQGQPAAQSAHWRRVFPGVAQVDLYGSTETDYIFVGDAFRDKLHVTDGNAFVELVSWCEELPDVFQIDVTPRDCETMPLLRYFTGDIVQRTPTGIAPSVVSVICFSIPRVL